MADTMDIKESLSILGLTDEEVKVYLLIINTSVASMMQLSRQANIPRSTVYRICKKLARIKLIEWVVERQGKRVKAAHPDQLDHLLMSKTQKLVKLEEAIKQIKSHIIQPHLKVYKTQVKFYQGKEGMKQLIWNTLQADRNLYGYSVYDRNYYTSESFEDEYTNEALRRGIRDRVIINRKSVRRAREAYFQGAHRWQEMRVIDQKGFYISGDTYIYNDVYGVNFWVAGEIVGVEIQNPEVVKVQKSIFKYIWQQAKPLKEFVKADK